MGTPGGEGPAAGSLRPGFVRQAPGAETDRPGVEARGKTPLSPSHSPFHPRSWWGNPENRHNRRFASVFSRFGAKTPEIRAFCRIRVGFGLEISRIGPFADVAQSDQSTRLVSGRSPVRFRPSAVRSRRIRRAGDSADAPDRRIARTHAPRARPRQHTRRAAPRTASERWVARSSGR